MKKKFLISLLAVLSMASCGLAIASCNTMDGANNGVPQEPTRMEKVYAQYVVYAQAEGVEPLSYESWLLSIKGEKGDKGENGQNGEDGKSAYEIWLDLGNEGTEADFIAWLKGEQGIQGEKGDKGDQGEQGVQGEKGDKGDQGIQGEKGENGQNGEDGKSAYQIWLDLGNEGTEADFIAWLKGKQGIQGEKGDKGDQGEQGIQGEKGENGQNGENGKSAYQIWLDLENEGTEADFIAWLKGEQGFQGEKGDKGDQGEQGIQGEKGENGQNGEDGKSAYQIWLDLGNEGTEADFIAWLKGEQGIQGEKGDKGEQGIQGEAGKDGQDGEDGKSAYEIWLDLGNEGTEADFIVWLKGEQGVQGEKGDQGEQGIQGEKGDKGDQGATGVGIEKVEYDENGDLKITFTDGSTQTIVMPDKHVHSFGDWTAFTTDEVPCENRLFFRTCTTCNIIEWKQGTYKDHDWKTVTTKPTCQAQGYDTKTCSICGKVETENYTEIVEHPWKEDYSYDNSFHWIDCDICDEIKDKQEHTVTDSGECSVCGGLVGATEGVMYDISADGTYAEVIGYEGTATKIRLAQTYQGLPVKTIYEKAFFDKGSITSATIPDSIISIGNNAFYGCDSLTDVVIGDSVTLIGDYAFSWCDSLTSVLIGKSVVSIGYSAFSSCNILTNVTIPNSATSIANNAFGNCDKLQFNEYGNCNYLGSEDNPYFALIKATNQNSSNYTIHESTKIIADSAFYNCSRMGSITIPNSVTSIGEKAFSVTSLTSVLIPDSVATIGKLAFSSCDKLCYAEIGVSVVEMGSAFYGLTSLVEIKFNASNCGDFESDWLPNSVKRVVIGRTVKRIPSKFFSHSKVEEVVFEEDCVCQEIGKSAFVGCDNLTKIILPNSLKVIGTYAFNGSSYLIDVILPKGLEEISENAFYDCSNLTNLYYEGTVEDWEGISIDSSNDNLNLATRYYYSQSEPALNADGTAYDGNYWHYDENNQPVVWEYKKEN